MSAWVKNGSAWVKNLKNGVPNSDHLDVLDDHN